jgi:hypothetical protein
MPTVSLQKDNWRPVYLQKVSEIKRTYMFRSVTLAKNTPVETRDPRHGWLARHSDGARASTSETYLNLPDAAAREMDSKTWLENQ